MTSDIRDHSKKCGHGFMLRHDHQTGRIYGEIIYTICPGGEKLNGETEAKAFVEGDTLFREERTTYTSEWEMVKSVRVP